MSAAFGLADSPAPCEDPSVPPWLPLCMLLLLAGCGTWGDGTWGDGRVVPDDDSTEATSDDDDSSPSPNADTDGDTIADADEGTGDPDGDGTPNSADADSDGDGLSDAAEAGDNQVSTDPIDSDFDGSPDFLDTDSDDNGIPDELEDPSDLDGDGLGAAADRDDDGDGISDEIEIGPNPGAPLDHDGDGVADFLDGDSDGDGIPDGDEGSDDVDGDGTGSWLDADSDGDGFSDSAEAGPDPANPADHDGDGFGDFEDVDSDNDGILDAGESAAGTLPGSRDTDGDGYTDLAEVAVGTNPADAASVITGFYAELPPRQTTEITVPFTPQLTQADVLFLLDSTCSMTEELAVMAMNFGQVLAQVGIPDLAFGVVDFNDYAWGTLGYSVASDKPFRLQQQITTQTSETQAALNQLFIHDGGDYPESSLEALYQALTGDGFDQNCDNTYDALTDVPPFLPHAGDAFGGGVAGIAEAGLPGSGTLGGAGFRDGSVPILVYTTDNYLRDSDNPAIFDLPPLCSDPAGLSDVVAAAQSASARLIGIGTDAVPITQMNALAQQTGSVADITGDGVAENLVFQGVDSSVVTSTIAGISAIANSGMFDLSLVVSGDSFGFVQGIAPATYEDVPVETTVTFTLSIFPAVPQAASDQVFVFPVQVIGDGITVLAEWELVLVVLAGN